MALILSRISQELFYLTNNARVEYDRKMLKRDPILTKAALYHSRDMAKNHYCDHINLKGEDPTDRVIRLGFDVNAGYYCGVGENCNQISIGKVKGSGFIPNTEKGIALGLMKNWRKSEEHWKNIIKWDYTQIGIGVATTNNKTYFATQVFYG